MNHRSGRPGTCGFEQLTATIYALSDPRTPHDYRYVGRTTWAVEDRVAAHIQGALSQLPDGRWRRSVTHKIAWLRVLARDGYRPQVTALATVPRADRIFAEQQWIAALNEAGYRLTNHTVGGEGPEMYKPSEETRRRQSEAVRRRFATDPAERERSRLLMQRLYGSEEGRQHLSTRAKAQWAQPGAREAHSKRLKAASAVPGMSERRSAAIRAVLTGPRGDELKRAMADRVAGERNPGARLTWEQVCEIRARYVPRVMSHSRLAKEYGVTPTLIGQIIRCLIWSRDPVTGDPVSPADGALTAPVAGRFHMTDDHYRRVVEIYRAADRHPTKAVAEAFGVTIAAAATWVKWARKERFLGPTRPGFSGEVAA